LEYKIKSWDSDDFMKNRTEEQENKEKLKIKEDEEVNGKLLSQYLYERNQLFYEKKKYDELVERYEDMRSDRFKEQSQVHELIEQTNQLEDSVKDLESSVKFLENMVRAYQSRKVVKIADKLVKTIKALKLFLKNLSNRQKSSIDTSYENEESSISKENTSYSKDESTEPEQKTIKYAIKQASKPKKLKDIKIAVIFDEFTYNSFKYEFNAVPIEPTNWLEVFETEKPDLFLCESAWSGGPWKGRIHYHGPKIRNRDILMEVLEYCNSKDIPTIFWNKEDPTNFQKFFDTAIKFDHIFTTAEECIDVYKEKYGHKSVNLLMFAAQPKMFNPIERKERTEDVIFAGSWYTHHTERSIEMVGILDNILDSGFNLKIYNRFHELSKTYPQHRFPEKYHEFLNLPVPHDQIEKIYKESKYSLNINTVTKSNTMFARRAVELMLCNTLVLSNYSKALDNLCGDNIIFIGNEKLDLSDSEEKRINNLYNILKNHTYSKRFTQLLNAINYDYLPDDNTVTIYYVVNNESEIEEVLEHYQSISYDSKKISLILSTEIPNHLIKDLYQKYSDEEVSVYSLNYLRNQHNKISDYTNKLWSFHKGKLNIPDETHLNDTPYFIFANLKLKKDFVEKAVLHYSYVDQNFGITLGDKFTFKNVNDANNVLLSNENFIKAFNNILKDEPTEFSVCNILI
jgi:hypothetical protein